MSTFCYLRFFFTFTSFFLIWAVRARIVGTKNIAKITKSMKMVSAAKLRGDNARLAAADPFSVRFVVSYFEFVVMTML